MLQGKSKITLNCCKDVKEGKTDWLRLRCKAARLRVVSEILLDIPNPAPARLEPCSGFCFSTGNAGGRRLVGVGGGLVWAPELAKPWSRGFLSRLFIQGSEHLCWTKLEPEQQKNKIH